MLVILLSMLMILFSSPSLIRHLIHDNNLSCILKLVLDGKYLQEYLVNAFVSQGPILSRTLLLCTLMTLLIISVLLLSMLMILLSTRCVI